MSGDIAASEPLRWTKVRVERIERRTPRVISVFLQPPILRQEAGQHVDVKLTAPDGYQAQRSYSIASAPGSPALELAIERIGTGEVSPYFHDVARPGDAVDIRGPIGGHFVWKTEDGGPILLVAGGSGVAPLMSIVRHARATTRGTPILLLYSARTWEELIFRDELLDLARRHDGFDFIAATTRGPRHRPDDLERRLDAVRLRETLEQWARSPRHAYVCGSESFVEALTRALVLEGVPAQRIRAERFAGSS